MKRETIAIHAGYDGDPTTKAVAVPIYQTVAFEFDSAEHGAALFNLEVQGNIYTRIGNPTNTVLEKRVAALEGGVDALSVSSGMAAIEYALINIAEMENNIVSTPQLYGATYTLLAHIFPKRGICSRFGKTDRPEDIEKLIDIDDIVIGDFRHVEHVKLFRMLPPRKLAAIDNHSTDAGAAAANELRHGMQDHVSSIFNRPQQNRRSHGVIDHQRHTVLVRHFGQPFNIRHVPGGIADTLAVNRASILVD